MSIKPTTKTDIANMALDLLNTENIGDLDNPTNNTERFLSRWYEHIKLTLLRKYNWGFAKSRAAILRVNTPIFEYTDAYKLPNDFVRFLEIVDYVELPGSKTYTIEGDKLLINMSGASSINIKYIADIENVLFFDSLFVNLLISYLAEKACYKFTMDKSLLAYIRRLIDEDERKAVSIFSQERPPKKIQISRFSRARRLNMSSIERY